MYNTLKTHRKYAHIVRGRPTLKDVERFRNGSVREPYERSLYVRTFVSTVEPRLSGLIGTSVRIIENMNINEIEM